MVFLKTILVDDEPGILSLLTVIFEELENAKIVGKAENGNDAITITKAKNPDLAFLDIDLPDMNGIELAEKLREIKNDIIIVFITGHEGYYKDAFKVYAADYITKPIDKERVKSTFKRIFQAASPLDRSYLFFVKDKDDNEEVLVNTNEILYIEKAKTEHYVIIHCINKEYKIRQTLRELEELLGADFYRSHKSYIINIKYIDRLVDLDISTSYIIRLKKSKGEALISRDKVFELKRIIRESRGVEK